MAVVGRARGRYPLPVKPAWTRALAVAGVVLSAATLGAAEGAPEVRREGGRLWIRAEDAAALDLLAAVSAKTDVAFELDPGVGDGTITLEVEGEGVERAVERLIDALPGAAGHSLAYARGQGSRARLVAVRVFAAGAPPAAAAPAPAASPVPTEAPLARLAPTPGREERLQKMVDAGLPPDTAERVADLAEDVREIHDQIGEEVFTPADLTPESREHLPELLARGVPEAKAVRMLLLQERYRETLEEIRRTHVVR